MKVFRQGKVGPQQRTQGLEERGRQHIINLGKKIISSKKKLGFPPPILSGGHPPTNGGEITLEILPQEGTGFLPIKMLYISVKNEFLPFFLKKHTEFEMLWAKELARLLASAEEHHGI